MFRESLDSDYSNEFIKELSTRDSDTLKYEVIIHGVQFFVIFFFDDLQKSCTLIFYDGDGNYIQKNRNDNAIGAKLFTFIKDTLFEIIENRPEVKRYIFACTDYEKSKQTLYRMFARTLANYIDGTVKEIVNDELDEIKFIVKRK